MSNSQIKYPTKVIRSESSPEWKDLAACLSGSLEEYSYTGGDWANVVLNNAYSEELEFSRHSFSIPASATITGIEFTYLVWAKSPFVAGSDVSPPATYIKDTTIRLMKNGVPTGDDKASAVGWPAYLNNYYFYDNFCNGVDGSSITSYTPNVGSSWNVSGSSNFSVRTLGSLDGTTTQETSLVFGSCVANKNSDENFRGVQLDTNLGVTTAWADSGSSDGTGGMIFYPYGTNVNSYWDFIFRRTDDFNFYFVRVVNLTRTVLLYKSQSGVEANLASYTWSSGSKEVGWKDDCGVGLLWKTSVVWSGSSVSIIIN
ncbi:MAG: hypothetical protein OPY06_03525, partial [Nitrosopumilus sp.]|nr:hypothetical protein [Nitrosopumilus sp.]